MVQLWETVGVYIVCVYSVCVCVVARLGGLSVHVFVPFFKLAVCMHTHLCGLNLGLFV